MGGVENFSNSSIKPVKPNVVVVLAMILVPAQALEPCSNIGFPMTPRTAPGPLCICYFPFLVHCTNSHSLRDLAPFVCTTFILNFLFIHQNFPGQFRHLAPALAALGHTVLALRIVTDEPGAPASLPSVQSWCGVRVVPYKVAGRNIRGLHAWLQDMETKTLRAEACWTAMRALRAQGFVPDAVIGHPGWGEPLFVKQVWPETRVGLYAEFFYNADGADMGFDPEFAPKDAEADGCRLQMKNLNLLAHLDQADGALSPTQWQANTFPPGWRERIFVAHDGIDTADLCPQADVVFPLPNAPGDTASAVRSVSRQDEVITFVARHLEPYRGFHIFLRCLPALLRERPKALVLIVGDDAVGYGSAAPAGQTWRQVFTKEVFPQLQAEQISRVHFLGRLDGAAFTQMFQVSRLHIYLSYPFVLSWSLIEAMSVGAAIVASDTAPVREVIESGVNGQLVHFFDSDALVAAMLKLLEQPAERERLGAAARKLAVERYDLKRICLPAQIAWALSLPAYQAS